MPRAIKTLTQRRIGKRRPIGEISKDAKDAANAW
jgi:hypothetical protein